MPSYSLTTKKTWSETQSELAREFELWGVSEWETNYPRGARLSGMHQSETDRTVRLIYTKDGHSVELVMGAQSRAVDNLRVLYLAIEAMRLNERRGIGDVVQSAYLQIQAPTGQRDPYEVLGIRSDAPLDVAEAAYRARVRTAHPDAGGSAEQVKELNEAIRRIRKEASE